MASASPRSTDYSVHPSNGQFSPPPHVEQTSNITPFPLPGVPDYHGQPHPSVSAGQAQHPYHYQYGPYPPWMLHDGSKIEGGPTTGIAVRYALMALHFVLLALTTILTSLFFANILFIAIHCALALAFLIYIPAALGLTIERRKNNFDHAGGEVAYLVVQWVGWLVCVIISATYISEAECGTTRNTYNYSTGRYVTLRVNSPRCIWASVTLALSAAHVLLLVGWMIWVVILVHRKSPGSPTRGYGISTAWLLRGWHSY